MDNNFLKFYTIPTIRSNEKVGEPNTYIEEANAKDADVDDSDNCTISYSQYQYPNRYCPPGKLDTSEIQCSEICGKRRREIEDNLELPSSKRKCEVATEISDEKLVIFYGRDLSYPNALNSLIHPLHCDLCSVKVNSPQNAKYHYESKVHDRNLTHWLNENYTKKGLNRPLIMRFYKSGPIGPDAFHCELCDLKLTSITHANQHYAGRKHQLVAQKISKPSGAGYYTAEGKWVRVGSKVGHMDDGRFGIGEQFKCLKLDESSATPEIKEDGGMNTSDNSQFESVQKELTQNIDTTTLGKLFCKICQIYATSPVQMKMHLEGSKHQKKLKKISVDTDVMESPVEFKIVETKADSILGSLNKKPEAGVIDYSMYRTPAGAYYCKHCNISVSCELTLQQHFEGKKHIRLANSHMAKKRKRSDI